ncbi:uncharacterized protein Pyn_23528 [Prunus yedoensis var. nudiflora]|uniref:Aminotransferase-like plant mobile domain-containing protein n=1 Tax=Prunus yedoensis var. nudiflora TaxID=2094558 RepID=A0A314ZLY4_PRUYE|nr:uncharacterized protein Pyn_23528 [Prunus yedoensis var. nudiflora]
MAFANLPLIMMDHLYSMDDDLKAGGPMLLLEEAYENPVIGDESSPETTPVIYPASISRCCIEKGLFPTVPLFFQYPCSISKGWSEWVDRELLDPSTCDILRWAQVLNAIFLSKMWDIHIEAKMLRHVVRRWSTATHTFYVHGGNLPQLLRTWQTYLASLFVGTKALSIFALTPEEMNNLAVLRKGAPTSPSTSLRFSNWIQYFGDANRQGPWWLLHLYHCGLGGSCSVTFLRTACMSEYFPWLWLSLVVTRFL